MPIKTIHADLLLETRGIIVHGASAQGVMGSGFAKVLCQLPLPQGRGLKKP